MKHKPASAHAPTPSDTDLQALLRCPLNDPGMVADLQTAWRDAGAAPTLSDLDLAHPLPRLSWLFDARYYLERNPDVAEAGLDPYVHFLGQGLAEGRDPHPLIHLAFIQGQLDNDASLTAKGLADAIADAKIDPHPGFDTRYYLARNPDVRDAGIPALEHFLRHGADEGRSPHPTFLRPDGTPGAPADAEANDAPETAAAAFLAFARTMAEGAGHAGRDDSTAAGEKTGQRAASVSSSEAHPESLRIEGMLDDIRDQMAYGWAYAPDRAGHRLAVEIVDGVTVVGRGTADLLRADLEQGGVGDGRHAYAIRLSHSLNDGHKHLLRARIASQPSTLLPGQKEFSLVRSNLGYDICPDDGREDDVDAHVPASASAMSGLFTQALQEINLLLESGQGEAAAAALSELVERYGQSPILWLKTGEAWLAAGRADLSLEAFDRVLAAGDALASWAWLGRGNAQALLGQWQQARDCYQRASECEPVAPPIPMRLANVERHDRVLEVRCRLGNGEIGEALQDIGVLLLTDPRDVTIQSLALETMEAQADSDGDDVLDAEAMVARRAIRLLDLTIRSLESERHR